MSMFEIIVTSQILTLHNVSENNENEVSIYKLISLLRHTLICDLWLRLQHEFPEATWRNRWRYCKCKKKSKQTENHVQCCVSILKFKLLIKSCGVIRKSTELFILLVVTAKQLYLQKNSKSTADRTLLRSNKRQGLNLRSNIACLSASMIFVSPFFNQTINLLSGYSSLAEIFCLAVKGGEKSLYTDYIMKHQEKVKKISLNALICCC